MAGLRYFVKPNLALYGDVGSGAGALHVGMMFSLQGGSQIARGRAGRTSVLPRLQTLLW
jgi:hypothetical protein